jgi:hypothetical protein
MISALYHTAYTVNELPFALSASCSYNAVAEIVATLLPLASVEIGISFPVIELMNKVESAISAFINKFYKSESSGDSKVSQ